MFAKSTGIDATKVSWVSMAPPLREPMLLRGEVDAVTGFYFTIYMNLLALGVKPDDIVAFLYADYGLPLYGNAVMARKDYVEKNPDAVRRFVRALNRAMHDVVKSPEEAVEYVLLRDPTVKRDVELARLKLALEFNMLTEEVKKNGFGAVDYDRLTRAIKVLREAFNLPIEPKATEVFTDEFLPPKGERMPKLP